MKFCAIPGILIAHPDGSASYATATWTSSSHAAAVGCVEGSEVSSASSPEGGTPCHADRPLDSLGRRRSPAAVPGYLAGRPPRNKGRRYPADPPRTEEIIAVMRCAGGGLHGARARALIVVLWRAGLRIQEALDLTELDLDARRGSVLVRRGKGGRRREVGMDDWGFEQLQPWLQARQQMPVGPLFCVIDGRTRGRAWPPSAARAALRRRAARAGVRRRFVPHQLRHAHAIELAREGVPLERHPTPTRAPQPRRDLDLPAGDRPGRDHRDHPRPTRADDPSQRRALALARPLSHRRIGSGASPRRCRCCSSTIWAQCEAPGRV